MATAKTRKKYHDLITKKGVNFSALKKESASFLGSFCGVMQDLHYEGKEKEFKRETVKYAKEHELDWKAINALDEKSFVVIGKYTTILNGDGELPDNYAVGFDKYMNALIAEGKEKLNEKKAVEQKSQGPVLTVQDYVRLQAMPIAEMFDEWLDTLATVTKLDLTKKPDPVKLMQVANFSSAHSAWVKRFYKNDIVELQDAIAGSDEDLKEGYAGYSKAQLKRMLEFLNEVVQAATLVSQAKKAVRKTRKKKAPSVEKQVEKIQFKTQDSELGVASVNPATIIGASQVWVYNSKVRKLIKFVALDEKGIGIKGTTLQNISSDFSAQKGIRKPKEVLASFMSAGKVKLRTFLDDIKAVESKPSPRLNEHCVILKVVK